MDIVFYHMVPWWSRTVLGCIFFFGMFFGMFSWILNKLDLMFSWPWYIEFCFTSDMGLEMHDQEREHSISAIYLPWASGPGQLLFGLFSILTWFAVLVILLIIVIDNFTEYVDGPDQEALRGRSTYKAWSISWSTAQNFWIGGCRHKFNRVI